MYPAKFDYVAASSVEEAVSLLEKGNGEAKLLAGGHSLLPLMKLRLAQPRVLVDIGRIGGLRYIREEGNELAIGALATYRDIVHSQPVRERVPVLAEAASDVGDPQVRARGTFAGALAHADPASDLPAVALALGARIRSHGPDGDHTYDVDSFFVDMLTTALGENELITEVRVPVLPRGRGAVYLKFDQPASHYALTGVCAVVSLRDGKLHDVRLGVTGVGPKPYRPTQVEQALEGQSATEDAVRQAVAAVTEGVDVQSDIHASTEYRAHLARVYARRAVLEAAARAGAG